MYLGEEDFPGLRANAPWSEAVSAGVLDFERRLTAYSRLWGPGIGLGSLDAFEAHAQIGQETEQGGIVSIMLPCSK